VIHTVQGELSADVLSRPGWPLPAALFYSRIIQQRFVYVTARCAAARALVRERENCPSICCRNNGLTFLAACSNMPHISTAVRAAKYRGQPKDNNKSAPSKNRYPAWMHIMTSPLNRSWKL